MFPPEATQEALALAEVPYHDPILDPVKLETEKSTLDQFHSNLLENLSAKINTQRREEHVSKRSLGLERAYTCFGHSHLKLALKSKQNNPKILEALL